MKKYMVCNIAIYWKYAKAGHIETIRGELVLGSKKILLIWSGLLDLVGFILLMFACEPGLLKPQSEQSDAVDESTQNDPVSQQSSGKPDTGRPAVQEPNQEPAEQEPETLTVGKPYSGKLVEEGSTNILIIGQDKVNILYDTIGIASIDSKNKKVKLIMIPRDTYIEYNDNIKAVMDKEGKLHTAGVFKINYTHHVGNMIDYQGKFKSGSISFLADVVEEKFNVELQDYVKLNTSGFRELIDHLGGVDIYVPYRMDYVDPTQDLVIDIQKGHQHLDGHDAEGFVRFRQGYNEDGVLFEIGDTGRKKNQLNFLKELIKQKGTVKNIGKIPGILEILGKNVQHSIGLGDVLTKYIGMATDVITQGYEIELVNLDSDNMIRVDGASYIVLD